LAIVPQTARLYLCCVGTLLKVFADVSQATEKQLDSVFWGLELRSLGSKNSPGEMNYQYVSYFILGLLF
jgi:hypothetical protein